MSTTGSRKMRLRKFDKLSHIPCLLAVPPLQVSQGSARELPMLCTVHAFVHMVSDGKEPPWYAMIKQSDETYETVPTSPGFGERKPGHPFIIVTKLVFGQLKHRRHFEPYSTQVYEQNAFKRHCQKKGNSWQAPLFSQATAGGSSSRASSDLMDCNETKLKVCNHYWGDWPSKNGHAIPLVKQY